MDYVKKKKKLKIKMKSFCAIILFDCFPFRLNNLFLKKIHTMMIHKRKCEHMVVLLDELYAYIFYVHHMEHKIRILW